MTFDLPTVQGLVSHYAQLQGLVAAGWRFVVDIVAGLAHNGEPAWAVVRSDPVTKIARVSVRDLVKTPLPCADPWHELKVTISHELWHPWVTQLLAAPTVENEEALVEAAAQAVVRSAGPDARVMARSILAIPAAVRARVAAREDPERDANGKFAGGAGHIKDAPAAPHTGSVSPASQAHWAATKAAEMGKTVYATPSDERHTGGFKLATKLGVRDSKKGYSAVHPDGSITHHNGGATRGQMHVYDDGKGGKITARSARARGGSAMAMNIDTVKKLLDAIEAGDSAAMAEVCKQLVAEAASASDGAAPAAPEPDGDELEAPPEAREEGAMPVDDPTKKPGGPPAARPVARAEDPSARRARVAADSLNKSAIRARVHEERIVNGVTLAPELEKLILAETDIEAAEKLLKVAALSRGDGSPARARTGATAAAAAAPVAAGKPKYNEAELVKAGIHPTMAKDIASETDDKIADLAYNAARARIATSTPTWPSAPKTGGAS